MELCAGALLLLLALVDKMHGQFYPFGNYNSRRSRYQQFYNNNNEFFRRNSIYNSRLSTTTTTTTTTTPRPSLTGQYADQCGLRHSGYRADQRARGGRIIWTDEESAGATSAPEGTFPWLASLFLRRESGEAYFMCAATILTPNVLVSAAHCFNEKWEDSDWFVRVGDNFILKADPSEQTFQVNVILKHEKFRPLSSPGGDGRNDVALLQIRNRGGRGIRFDKYVRPACLPAQGERLHRWSTSHCEISGWGMQEYNNTASYPDSVRAARIEVGAVKTGVCNYLYGRDVKATGKFCAGGVVDACQEDSGGPLMCHNKGRYELVGIVSSGKGCGVYPGLYTEVSRYSDWIEESLATLENEVQ